MRNRLPKLLSSIAIICFFIAYLTIEVASAQQNLPTLGIPNAPVSDTETDRLRTQLLNIATENQTSTTPNTPSEIQQYSEETRTAHEQAWQAYYAYITEGYAFRQRVYDWQDFSTKGIFFVVIILVLLGMYFAAIQFHVGLKQKHTETDINDSDDVNLESDIEVSVKGVRVRSPVLGVVILVISLAFFYLYLVYVYPITNSL